MGIKPQSGLFSYFFILTFDTHFEISQYIQTFVATVKRQKCLGKNYTPEFVLIVMCFSSLYFSLIVSEEPVFRDQFYNGNMKTERGAVNYHNRSLLF